MKFSVVVGVVAGLGIIVFVNAQEGDPLAALINVVSAVIVIGGCLAACISHFSFKGCMRAVRGSTWLISPPRHDAAAFIKQAIDWARAARRNGLLSLEQTLGEIKNDAFLHDGLQMVVDGVEIDALRTLLHVRIDMEAKGENEAAEFWDGMGGYAPTLGVLGAVMGLIHVMLHLDGGVAALGTGIAEAFTATMYGVGLANLIFIPMGKRLSKVAEEVRQHKEMVVEGMLLLAGGASPQSIETSLQSYAPHAKRAAPKSAEEPAAAAGEAQPQVASHEP